MGSGFYATASYFAQQAPTDVTVTTTLFTTTTSWTTSTIWSTVTSTVLGVLTAVQYTTSTSTVTVTGSTTGGTSVIIDSYSETNRNDQQGIRASGPTQSGEAIPSHPTAFTISSIKFDLARVNSPGGFVYANVYACTGTPGSTGVPTGAPLGTSIGIDVSTLSTSWTLVQFTFATPVYIAAGENYCISASFSAGNGVLTGLAGVSPSFPGNWFISGWTAIPSYNMIFYVYGKWVQ
jgi:hypothetical protein